MFGQRLLGRRCGHLFHVNSKGQVSVAHELLKSKGANEKVQGCDGKITAILMPPT